MAKTIEEAVESLRQKLADDEVFHVRHNNGEIIVDVNFVYRIPEVEEIGKEWEGFPLRTGRRSCW